MQVLQRDPQLVFSSGREAGKLRFPWSYGVVFPNLTRRQFEEGGLGEVIPEARVICQDEMLENVEPEAFQQRLWAMFSVRFESPLSPAQIDRLRWALFPEVRIPATQGELFAEAAPPPDLVRVMDLQQEQLARSLGEGHRVIHGVAGSGKTLILLYRAEHLARLVNKPILVLCYNEALARRLASLVAAKGLAEAVAGLSPSELVWASGYLFGLAQAGGSLGVASSAAVASAAIASTLHPHPFPSRRSVLLWRPPLG